MKVDGRTVPGNLISQDIAEGEHDIEVWLGL